MMEGSDIVAPDATGRPRLRGLSLARTLAARRPASPGEAVRAPGG